MSIYYDVLEHICISDTAEHEDTTGIFSYRLVRIGALMLDDCARFYRLRVITDGKKREFSGNTVTEEYHGIIRAIEEAKSVEIVAEYGYYEYMLSVLNPGVLDIADHLNERIDEEGADSLKGMFYSMYHNADCSDNAGAIVAYGEKNGQLYTGQVKEKSIDVLPEGSWYAPFTDVQCELEKDEMKNVDEIEAICLEMTKFSSSDTLSVDDKGLSFFLNNHELHNNEELIEFIGLCRKLIRATDGKACAEELNLADLGGDDGKIVKIKINDDGTHEIFLCSVE